MTTYLSWFGYNNQSKETEETKEATKEGEQDSRHGNITRSEGQPSAENEEQNLVEKHGDVEALKCQSSTKQSDESSAKDIAKNVGSFLYGFATSAGKKLKERVDETLDKGIIGDFNRENEKFIKEKHSKDREGAVLPWVGYREEEDMKKQILALALDERSFLRDPPPGADFHFNLDSFMPIAMVTLKEDPNLKNMRFNLVPRKISEVSFWRNYFYRVSLIKQSSQLMSLSRGDSKNKSSSSLDKVETAEKSAEEEGKDHISIKVRATDESHHNSMASQEFVSDSLEHQGSEALSKEEMKQIGVGAEKATITSNNGQDIAEWEKEIQEELNDFEFVSEDQPGADTNDADWEKEIEDMLELEETQEKK